MRQGMQHPARWHHGCGRFFRDHNFKGKLSMNSPVIVKVAVIANAVKQSMSLDCMDCRATLAVTKALFKVRVRYLAGYGGLAMKLSTAQKLIKPSALGLLMAAFTSISHGAVDADAAVSLAKKSDCLKCHAVDKDKKAASFKHIAEKWKGKADAQAKLTEAITKGPKVKLKDGSEEAHKVIASQDANEIKNVVDWILSR
jgi:cytochrome c